MSNVGSTTWINVSGGATRRVCRESLFSRSRARSATAALVRIRDARGWIVLYTGDRATRGHSLAKWDPAVVTSQFFEGLGDPTVGRRDHGPLGDFTVRHRPEIDSRGLSRHAADRSEGEWRYRHGPHGSPRELRCRAGAIRRVLPLDHDRPRGPAHRAVVNYPAAGRAEPCARHRAHDVNTDDPLWPAPPVTLPPSRRRHLRHRLPAGAITWCLRPSRRLFRLCIRPCYLRPERAVWELRNRVAREIPGLAIARLGNRHSADDVAAGWTVAAASAPSYPTRETAVLYAHYTCRGGCGEGRLIRLRRDGASWRIAESQRLWVG